MGTSAAITAPDVSRCIPLLRRHARMLLGQQTSADECVARALEALHGGGSHIGLKRDDLIVEMFRALYRAIEPRDASRSTRFAPDAESVADARLGALSPVHRSILLLTAVEGLSHQSVGAVLARPVEEVEQLAEEAQILLERELETSVLIIEDEWAIARDLRSIVTDLGHTVTDVASTRAAAVDAAKRRRPGLVLADINLADGSSGVDAVRDILQSGAAPTIFITGFPERLLTGERPEPTYLISKPYSAAMVQAAVSQALFFSDTGSGRA